MSGVVKFSEAASLALHTMSLLASEPDKHMSVREIVERLPVSENHLAKVLQRLTKAGLIESVRGPKGGFLLKRNPEDITLLEVYEVIEGPLPVVRCLFPEPKCNGNCILGDLVGSVNDQIREKLAAPRLSQLADIFGRKA